MIRDFRKYFLSHIFNARTRQRLLILATAGLILSSFSLLVLQSTMGGLQKKRIERSKAIFGDAIVRIIKRDLETFKSLKNELTNYEADLSYEYVIELLMQNGAYIAPVIAHGVSSDSFKQNFLPKDEISKAIVPIDLAYKLSLATGDIFRLISPGHTDVFFGEIPRQISLEVMDVTSSGDQEVDSTHIWLPDTHIHNLIKEKTYNLIRIFGDLDYQALSLNLKERFGDSLYLETWEEQNGDLVWSLRLESIVMTFLFSAMTLLVSLCITSGLIIFLSHIKLDLASFWILGASKSKIYGSTSKMIHVMAVVSIAVGLLLGFAFLLAFDFYGPEVMPDVFVDRKIPIDITLRGVLISFLVPFTISWVFSEISLFIFKRDNNYLDYIRALGR